MCTMVLKALSACIRGLGSVGDISVRAQSPTFAFVYLSSLNVPLESHEEFLCTRK